MLEVVEYYIAPQGEGPNLGRSSLFLRLALCNLRCSWCDSKFTWSKNNPGYNQFQFYEPDELVGVLVQYVREQPVVPRGLVVTGGEPLLYQRELPYVIGKYWSTLDQLSLVELVADAEVETNGTIVPSQGMLELCDFNVSPKLATAGNAKVPLKVLWNEAATKAFLKNGATFKLVVRPDDEVVLMAYLKFLREVANELELKWASVLDSIYLMPEATTQDELVARQGYVIELAQKLGVRVTTRLQVLAFGKERRR